MTRKMSLQEKETWNFIILTTPLHFSLSGMFVWCVACLCYKENLPMKNAKVKIELSLHVNLQSQWAYLHLLHLSVMNTVWEIKKKHHYRENYFCNFMVLTMPLDSSLSGTLIRCVTCICYIEHSPRKMQKTKLSFQLNQQSQNEFDTFCIFLWWILLRN